MSGSDHQPTPTIPLLERVATTVGVVVTLGMLGAIAWQAFDGADAPPAVVVAVERIARVEGGYRVEFRARNMSGGTAAQVEIVGALKGSGGEAEEGRAVIDYIPGRSSRHGGLFFQQDPGAASLSVRASGYAAP
jgi:uncharacterized protein (TIGR02588 family)